jgi:hypothetical protein
MRGEKYVYTVAEAEKAGFRRARKLRPDQKTAVASENYIRAY